ncbi:hypothetical protein SRIMM317S_00357 [Streptomyces rimosus subsp. rimosus]
MARPRKFDEERAVDAAMHAFRAAGYEATSTQDLCEATGLGRSSIYNTFKSKHDLFERALDRYMGERNGELFALMESDLPVREKIRTHLERVVEEECGEQDDRQGCLVVNTAVEVAARDQQVAGELARDYRVRLEVDPRRDRVRAAGRRHRPGQGRHRPRAPRHRGCRRPARLGALRGRPDRAARGRGGWSGGLGGAGRRAMRPAFFLPSFWTDQYITPGGCARAVSENRSRSRTT